MGKTGNMDAFQVPTYNYTKPAAGSFSLYGTTASKSGDNWSVNQSGNDANTMNQVKKIRQELLSSLGVGGGSQYDPYTNTLMKESLREAQPKLENALIGRGMGGSSVYGSALTDLMSKAGTQAVLNGQNYKLNNLGALQDYLQRENNSGIDLLNQASAYDINNQNLAMQEYDRKYQQLLSQAMADYEHSKQPSKKDLMASKVWSIIDPGGSYMGTWNNPTKTGQNAQSMQGLGKAMELYSAWRSMGSSFGGGAAGGGAKSQSVSLDNSGGSSSPFGSGTNRNYSLLNSNGSSNDALLHKYYYGY